MPARWRAMISMILWGSTGDSVRRPKRLLPLRLIALGALCLAALLSFVLLRVRGDQSGGDPQAIAAIGTEKPTQPDTAAQKPVGIALADKDKAGTKQSAVENAAELEQMSGVKVVRAGGGAAPAATIIEVPRDLGVALTPAPDRRLVENSRYGPLPRIGTNGERPADVYARPLVIAAALKGNAPRIALVVGALGLNSAVTETAITSLPGAVTLAFAPYGKNLDVAVAEAREQGHEVILRTPDGADRLSADEPRSACAAYDCKRGREHGQSALAAEPLYRLYRRRQFSRREIYR